MTAQLLTTSPAFAGQTLSLVQQDGTIVQAAVASADSIQATLHPLSTVLYVDSGFAGTDTPNGSIGAPFLTVQAAIDAASSNPDVSTTIYIAPGTYADPINAGTKFVALIGMVPPTEDRGVLINNTVNANTDLFLQNLILAGTLTGTILTLLDCQMRADISGASANISSSTNGGNTFYSLANISLAGGLTVTRMNLQGNLNVDSALIDSCVFEAVAQAITVNSSASGTDICTVLNSRKSDAANVVNFICSVEGGNIAVDNFSNQYFNNNVTTTFTQKRVLGACADALVSVNVPAVTAGDVGYANVDLSGTALNGTTTTDVVACNPTDDLVAAGAGGGYGNCRISALNTARLTFLGATSAAAHNFRIARVTRSALP